MQPLVGLQAGVSARPLTGLQHKLNQSIDDGLTTIEPDPGTECLDPDDLAELPKRLIHTRRRDVFDAVQPDTYMPPGRQLTR